MNATSYVQTSASHHTFQHTEFLTLQIFSIKLPAGSIFPIKEREKSIDLFIFNQKKRVNLFLQEKYIFIRKKNNLMTKKIN
jgi:hypothetical protein